jgi:osmotically-inducible protein OsmY
MNTDSEILENVTEALNWDAAVDSSKLTVSVRDNLVTLKGQVRNYSEKIEARRAAQCVAGVRAVNVMIDVLPLEAGSDSEIAGAVVMALSWEPWLPGDLGTVQSEDGCVYLSGAVEWNYQRRNAANAMCYRAGVKGFINNMTSNGAND